MSTSQSANQSMVLMLLQLKHTGKFLLDFIVLKAPVNSCYFFRS